MFRRLITTPLFVAAPLVRVVQGVPPEAAVALLSAAAGGSGAGRVLLESSDAAEAGAPPRSILVTRPWLRVQLRDGRVEVEPLADDTGPLVDGLRGQLARCARPMANAGTGLDDDARLRAPGALDGLRVVAGAVADPVGSRVPMAPGLFGAFAHDLVDRFETLPPRSHDPLDEPDASFVLAGDMIVFEPLERRAVVVTRGLPWQARSAVRARHARQVEQLRRVAASGTCATPPVVGRAPLGTDVDDAFCAAVETVRAHIADGDVFQTVLSRARALPSAAAPLAVYSALRADNPSPYQFYLELPRGVLMGASPETFLKVGGGVVETMPIAGTAPRGRRPGAAPSGEVDPDLDARLALALQLDRKELAEHCMLLDLARNDIARVSVAGSTRVVEQLRVVRYRHVQHLVSRVQGVLRPGLDALHAYRALANAGTLTGAPKLRALELIRALEPQARGFYGGAVGYLLQDGSLDTCITIRALRYVVGAAGGGGVYHVRAGAGVVWLSEPERELAETAHKMRACVQAVAAAEALSDVGCGAEVAR